MFRTQQSETCAHQMCSTRFSQPFRELQVNALMRKLRLGGGAGAGLTAAGEELVHALSRRGSRPSKSRCSVNVDPPLVSPVPRLVAGVGFGMQSALNKWLFNGSLARTWSSAHLC